MRGFTTSAGSFGKAKNPKVACHLSENSDAADERNKIDSSKYEMNKKYIYLQYMISGFNC